MKNNTYLEQYNQLEGGTFEKLCIIRNKDECYLVISSEGRDHVLAGRNSKRFSFRHVWQMKAWLKQQFNIDGESIEYRNLDHM